MARTPQSQGLTDNELRALSDEVCGEGGWTEAIIPDDELQDLRWELVEAVQALRTRLAGEVVWTNYGADGPYVGDLDELVRVLAGIDHALAAAARLRSVIDERTRTVEAAGSDWHSHVEKVRRYRAEMGRLRAGPGPVVEVEFVPGDDVTPPPAGPLRGPSNIRESRPDGAPVHARDAARSPLSAA